MAARFFIRKGIALPLDNLYPYGYNDGEIPVGV